jgi:hypothetical protein
LLRRSEIGAAAGEKAFVDGCPHRTARYRPLRYFFSSPSLTQKSFESTPKSLTKIWNP